MKDIQSEQSPAVTSDARPLAGRSSTYIYAFVPANSLRTLTDTGIGGNKIDAITQGEIAAIISDVPLESRLRPERRHLEAHNRVIKRLLADGTVLPLAFGTVAANHSGVRRILARNASELARHLDRLDHKLEMGLRVIWDVPNIFEYFVQTHPELSAARDRLLGQRHAPTQDDKIEVGRMFEQALNSDREKYTSIVENALSRSCLEFKRNRCRNELDAMNLACLVDRDARADFETAVLAAAQLFDNNFAFDYNGPWAPHSFVNLSLKA